MSTPPTFFLLLSPVVYKKAYIVFYPEKFNSIVVEKNLSNIIQIIRIELPDDLKGKYTHRDYLGAVIKLGVERKKIGDIRCLI